jgi:hypothetical protein
MDEKIKFVCDGCSAIKESDAGPLASSLIVHCSCGGHTFHRYHCPDLDWENPDEARKIFEAWAGGRKIHFDALPNDGFVVFNKWGPFGKLFLCHDEKGDSRGLYATKDWHLYIPEKEKDLITPSVVLIGPVYTCPICGEEATVTHGEETVYETHTCGACTGAICITLVEIATYGQWYNVSKNCWREETYLDESYDASNWHTHPSVQKRWAEIGRTCRPGEEVEGKVDFSSKSPDWPDQIPSGQGPVRVDETEEEYMNRAYILNKDGVDKFRAFAERFREFAATSEPCPKNFSVIASDEPPSPAQPTQYEYTHTAKFEFENGDTVEIPAPGDGWEMTQEWKFDWPHQYVDRCLYHPTPSIGSDDLYIVFHHIEARIWLGDFHQKLFDEKARIVSQIQYRREVKPPETTEPERYQSAYEFL